MYTVKSSGEQKLIESREFLCWLPRLARYIHSVSLQRKYSNFKRLLSCVVDVRSIDSVWEGGDRRFLLDSLEPDAFCCCWSDGFTKVLKMYSITIIWHLQYFLGASRGRIFILYKTHFHISSIDIQFSRYFSWISTKFILKPADKFCK